MDSITANYFALFEVINHSFGKSFHPFGAHRQPRRELGGASGAWWHSFGPYLCSQSQEPLGGIGQAQRILIMRSPQSLMAFSAAA